LRERRHDAKGNAMATVTLTRGNFIETVQSNGTVLVDFWAAWCGPCRRFGPVFEAASESNPDIVFGKVDTEAEPELAGAFRITSIPTLMAFREGILVFAQPGALPASSLESLIGQIQALDMEDVRARISGETAPIAGS
jgi:thioredoxin 1